MKRCGRPDVNNGDSVKRHWALFLLEHGLVRSAHCTPTLVVASFAHAIHHANVGVQ